MRNSQHESVTTTNGLALYESWVSLDQKFAVHLQFCFDQRDEVGCATCADLSRREWSARKAMESSIDAMAIYNAPGPTDERRAWSREYLATYTGCQRED